MSDTLNTNRGNGMAKKVAAIAGGAILVILILLLLRSCGSCEQPAPAASSTPEPSQGTTLKPGQGTVSAEELAGMSQEEIQEMLNEQAALGYITISMNMKPIFADGKSEGNVLIENDKSNLFPQVVELYRQDTNELIYTSPVIPVGSYVHYDKLAVDLDAGEYPCLACFYNVDGDLNVVGQGNAEILLTVTN